MNLETLLNEAQSFLHDDGEIWPRSELLRWADDGYRRLCFESGVVRRPLQSDVPGRTACAVSAEWEHTYHPGTYRVFTLQPGNRELSVTFLWEVEALDGVTPTNSYVTTTQLWEMDYSGETDQHFRFALPAQNDRPLKVYWDSKRLAHTSVREQDNLDTRWWIEGGEPLATLPGLGSTQSLEVYLVRTDYTQAYNLTDSNTGLPRQFSSDASRSYTITSEQLTWDYAYTSTADSGFASGMGLLITATSIDATVGSRGTYSWEADLTSTSDDENGDTAGTIYSHSWEDDLRRQIAVGLSRFLTSADRQYLAASYDTGQDLLGTPRKFGSSDSALTIWHTILPNRPLTEEDEPDLIPDRFHKSIKFYVLAQAFGRKGEGQRLDLAEHFNMLFKLGVGHLAMLGTPSAIDRVYAREQVKSASIQAPPRVRFPANFPAPRR